MPDEPGEPATRYNGVFFQQDDIGTITGRIDANVVGFREAEIMAVLDKPQPRLDRSHPPEFTYDVGPRSVVDHDHFEVGVGRLFPDAFEAETRVFDVVQTDDNDGRTAEERPESGLKRPESRLPGIRLGEFLRGPFSLRTPPTKGVLYLR